MNYIENYFKNARIGDKVVDIVTNEVGVIESIDFTSHYPILVKFSKHSMSYTVDGRKFESEKLQRLFYKGYEPKIEIPEPPIRKFELFYDDIAYVVGHSSILDETDDIGLMSKYGRLRKTKEAAEQALKLQTRVMRLHALAEQLGGLKEFKEGEDNYYICKTPDRYELRSSDTIDGLTVVWMTKECAEKICEMLNNGEFSLEVEDDS